MLTLFPLKDNQHVHHLLYASGVVASSINVNVNHWLKAQLSTKHSIVLSEQIFTENSVEDFLNEYKISATSITVIFNISDLQNKDQLLRNLSEKNIEIIILANKELSSEQVAAIQAVSNFSDKISLFLLENKNHPSDHFLEDLPSGFKNKTFFVYLPKQHVADSLLSPHEIIDRIEFRKRQCLNLGIEFKLASFGAGPVKDANLARFYEEPCLANYLKFAEKKNPISYIFITFIRVSGLAGFFGFIFWCLKILLNPGPYNISLEFRGWFFRLFGWARGLSVDLCMLVKEIFGVTVAISVRSYWFIKRNLGRSWELRVLAQSLIGQGWKIKVFAQRAFSQRWKLKFLIMKIFPNNWKIVIFIQSLWSQRWKLKAFVERVYGQSWKLRVFFQRVIGQSWRARVFALRVFNWIKWKLINFLWKMSETVFFPIKKLYWFLSYQYKKRISKTWTDGADDGK